MANVMVRTCAAMTSARLFGPMFNALAFSRRPIFEKGLLNARRLAGAVSERARVDELSAHRVIDFGRVEHPK